MAIDAHTYVVVLSLPATRPMAALDIDAPGALLEPVELGPAAADEALTVGKLSV